MTGKQDGPRDFPPRVRRYGKDEPLPERREVRAGPLTATLEGGDLRYVRLGDDMVVLRLYAAIRDRNWGTIEPVYTHYELDQGEDSFSLRFTAENRGGDIDFVWDGSIVGTPEGVITATMDGTARKSFLKNRIGWCVLHPMSLAGTPATVRTPDGEVSGAFPDLISPHQPFIDMQSIAHGTPGGGRIEIEFSGDLFEMEDQRNWTDASYKTYSTPLRLPFPVEMATGDRVHQQVRITGIGGKGSGAVATDTVRVTIDRSQPRPLPAVGLVAAGHDAPLSEREAALLGELHPTHLHATVDLTVANWRERLDLAAAAAKQLGCDLELEVITDAGDEGPRELATALAATGVAVARVLVFPRGEMVSTPEVLAAMRAALKSAGLETAVGGGSRAFFTELNRATLPLDQLDVVGYTLNPQVHAFDNASITETLAAQAETVRSARAIVGDRPLVVGPITFKMRFNPVATGPEAKPAPRDLPPSVDYRQPSLFAAGWLAGSVNALANAGVEALTYFETTGWRGVMERCDHQLRVEAFHSWPGMIFPVYHVLADIAEFRGGEVLLVTTGDELRVQALAHRDGGRLRVILANMTDDPVEVALELPAAPATIRRLDDETFVLAASEPEVFRRETLPLTGSGGVASVALPPFGVATIDTRDA